MKQYYTSDELKNVLEECITTLKSLDTRDPNIEKLCNNLCETEDKKLCPFIKNNSECKLDIILIELNNTLFNISLPTNDGGND